jgi:guanylate cyclase
MVRFGLETLQVIDAVNEKLWAFLAVRISLNSGGSIIAGVLGTDRPTFDIIGDTINVAARPQSTDVPGSGPRIIGMRFWNTLARLRRSPSREWT